MASTVKHLRSSTASKRPTASGLAEGQLAINTASGTPGLFLKNSAGAVVKVGPVHVGASAPNAVPAGSAGNSTGELWVNNSATIHGLNYYTGSAFVNLTPSGTTTVAGLVGLATNAETQTGTDTVRAVTPSGLQSKVSDSTSTTSSTTIASSTAVKSAYDVANAALPKAGGRITGNLEIGPAGSLSFEGSSDDSFETTLAVVNPTADRTITLPNTTGTVITTGDSGTVTSAMIADLNIVNADINASAAIALSKLATGALPTAITVASANIVNGTIVNADISASAAIADTKLDTISTAGKVSGTAITSGDIATSGDLEITSTTPIVRLAESDGTATHSQTAIVRNNDQFLLQTRSSTGVLLSNDYLIPADASGATEHQWRIANTEKARLDSTGLTVVNDLTISDKIIHAGDTNTAIRFPAADTVAVETDGTERLRIKSDGESYFQANNTTSAVTINQTGTGNALVVEDSTNPDATPFVIDETGRTVQGHTVALSLNGTGGTPTCQLNTPASTLFAAACYSAVNWGDTPASPGIFLAKARAGAVGTYTIVPNNQNLGEIRFAGADGSQFQNAAAIGVQVDGTPSDGIVPGRVVFETANSSGTLTEAMRITSTGAVLVGATAAPTDVADGDIALQNRLVMNASASNYGQFQRIADVGTNITATTGTIVFKFKSSAPTSHRSAFVKINLAGRANNSTPSNSPACEYAFQLHQTSGGICSINGTTTIFEYTFVRATHFAFADLGSGECTVTLTNPVAVSLIPAYMVEINTQAGTFGLDAVTIT
jgi:hypothetical protein